MQSSQTKVTSRFLRSARVALSGHVTPSTRSQAFSAYPPNDMKVEHDETTKRFYIRLGSEEAVLEYERLNNTLDMLHTEVPSVFRGQGTGAVLAKAAFDYVVKNDLQMKLSCDYLQKYFGDNSTPELKKRLVPN